MHLACHWIYLLSLALYVGLANTKQCPALNASSRSTFSGLLKEEAFMVFHKTTYLTHFLQLKLDCAENS